MMTRNKWGGGLKDEEKIHCGEEVNMKKLIRSTIKGDMSEIWVFLKRGVKYRT